MRQSFGKNTMMSNMSAMSMMCGFCCFEMRMCGRLKL